MSPNCRSISGRQSTLAPPSQSMKKPWDLGSSGAKATRLTPRMRLAIMVAPTTRAPLFPALAKASPLPWARARRPTAMELSGFSFKTALGSSSMVRASLQSKISIWASWGERPSSLAQARSFSLSPARASWMPSSVWAWAQPRKISPGALSPPKASTMIFIPAPPVT